TSAPALSCNGWVVATHALDNTTLEAFVVCLTGPFEALSGNASRGAMDIPPGGIATPTLACPSSSLLTSGVYRTTTPNGSNVLVNTFATNYFAVSAPTKPSEPSRQSVTSWMTTIQNKTSQITSVIVELACIQLRK